MKVLAACVLLAILTITGAAAQTAAPVARTPDGQPDIQGYWTEEPGGPDAVNVENGFQTADSLRVQGWTDARLAARVPVSAIIDAPGGRIPYQPWAMKRHEEIFHRYGGDEITGSPQTVRDVSSELLCVIGAPRLMFFADFQIVQTPDMVLMLFEYVHATRNVFMNSPHLKGPLDWWMGDSRGRWDGDALVVDASNFNAETWFDRAGNFHSDALHVVERYTLADRDHINYAATIEDPKVFTRPWTINLVFYRHTEPNFRLLDYECYAFALDVPIVPTN
jgi:hypothetical protein